MKFGGQTYTLNQLGGDLLETLNLAGGEGDADLVSLLISQRVVVSCARPRRDLPSSLMAARQSGPTKDIVYRQIGR